MHVRSRNRPRGLLYQLTRRWAKIADRGGTDLGEDVAHRREDGHWTGDLVQVLSRRRRDPPRLHQRHIEQQLSELTEIRDQHGHPFGRLRAVLTQYVTIAHRRGLHASDLATLLHRDQHVNVAEHQIKRVIRDLLAEAAEVGYVRNDVDPDELAKYCLHALKAASSMASTAAVDRLVAVTLSGLSHPTLRRRIGQLHDCADTDGVQNLRGWLTRGVARCKSKRAACSLSV